MAKVASLNMHLSFCSGSEYGTWQESALARVTELPVARLVC